MCRLLAHRRSLQPRPRLIERRQRLRAAFLRDTVGKPSRNDYHGPLRSANVSPQTPRVYPQSRSSGCRLVPPNRPARARQPERGDPRAPMGSQAYRTLGSEGRASAKRRLLYCGGAVGKGVKLPRRFRAVAWFAPHTDRSVPDALCAPTSTAFAHLHTLVSDYLYDSRASCG
jgi:hypothetical protein